MDLFATWRGKFKEEEGASERPNEIEYLSIHWDISQLILGSPLEVQKVPVRGFLQTAHTNWNSLWESWLRLPDFAWRQVWGGLCCNEDCEKAPAEIQLDSSWLSWKLSWWSLSSMDQDCCPEQRGHCSPSAHDQAHPPRLDRWEFVLLMSNAWTNMWNKRMEERVRVERQNSKKGFLHSGGSFHGFRSFCQPVVELAALTWKILSKLWQVLKWKPEITDTQLGLTGIATLPYTVKYFLFAHFSLNAYQAGYWP